MLFRSLEAKQLHEGSHDESHFQLPQMFAGAYASSVAEAEMQRVFRTAFVLGEVLPALGSEFVGGEAGELLSPVILVPIRVPDIEQNVSAAGDKHSPLV